MRAQLVLAVVLVSLSLPAEAQEAPQKSKTATHRTYAESIDMSDSQVALRGFIEAFAASDYARAYMLLSPDAKTDFVTKVYEYNSAQFFPDLPEGATLGGVLLPDEQVGPDIIKDTLLDGASMFDRVMLGAEQAEALPFDFEAGAFFSPTFEQEDQARYLVTAKGEPATVVISTVRLSNGDWRVERIVWGFSDPQGRPWGFK
ncbi:MAG: hypothetical protein WBA73_14635 [Devosia sp.]